MATLYVGSDQTYKTIQEAVNAASTTEANEIIISAGTYNEDITLDARTMEQKGDIKFIAAEGAEVVFAGLITIGYYEKRVGSQAWKADVAFENITFDQATDAKHSIDVQQCNDFTMTNCKVIGDGEYGISGTNVDNGATITGTTFENAAIQSAGSFGTDFLIDDCTFNESRVNIQSGNSVTIKNSTFNGILTDANVGDSFYCVRSNDNAINIENTTFNIDSELTEVAGEQEKWGVLWQRSAGGTKWNAEDITVNFSDKAMEQTELLFNKNGTTTPANEAGRITINGLTSTDNDVTDLLAKSEGMLNAAADGVSYVLDDGVVQSKTAANQLVVSADVAEMAADAEIVIGGYTYIVGKTAFATINAALTEAKKSTEKITIEIAAGDYTENVSFGNRTFVENETTYTGGITFKAVDGAEVNINGYFQCNSPANDIKDVVFEGLNITNSVRNGGYFAPIMFGDNYAGKTASGLAVKNCTLTSTADGGTASGVALAMTLKCDGIDISKNTINADCGVYGGDGNLIANTNISGNTMNGNETVPNYNYWGVVYIYNSGEGNVISGNEIKNSALDYAVKVNNGEGVILTDNTITDCGETVITNGSVVTGTTIDGSSLSDSYPAYDGSALIVCGGIAGGTGDTVVIDGKSYVVGTNAYDSLPGALNNAAKTEKIEIVGDITEAGPAANTTVELSKTLTISGGNVTWTSASGWVYFCKAENAAEDTKLIFDGFVLNATDAKKAFFFDIDTVIDADSAVSIYNAKISSNSTVEVQAGGKFNVYKEELQIDAGSTLKITGSEVFTVADAELDDRQMFLQYSRNVKGTIEIEDAYVASYQGFYIKDNGKITADNSLIELGNDAEGVWHYNPVSNGYGELRLNSETAELNLNNGSVLKVSGNVINSGAINVSGSSLIANGTLVSDGVIKDAQNTGKFTNNGTIKISGDSTLVIRDLAGKALTFGENAALVDSTINYTGSDSMSLDGATFKGDNTINAAAYATSGAKITVAEGGSLTATGGRWAFGGNADWEINGEIENVKALTAEERAALKASLDVSGISLSTGGGEAVMDVNNAYVTYGSGAVTTKNTNVYGGKMTLNFTNSYLASAYKIAVNPTKDGYDAANAPEVEMNFKNSVVEINNYFTNNHAKGTVNIDNSNFTATAFGNVGKFNVTNGSKVNFALVNNALGDWAGKGSLNAGTITVDASELTIVNETATLEFYNVGGITLSNGAKFTVDQLVNAKANDLTGSGNINTTFADMTGEININGATLDADSFVNNGTLNITGKSEVTGSITNNGTVSISGETSTDLTVTGNAVEIEDGAVITDTTINGEVDLTGGESTWSGKNTVNGIFSAGYNNYGGDLTTNITGEFINSNFLTWAQDGSKTVVNIGSKDAGRTTFNGGQIGEFENSEVNVVNADVTYTYSYIRGNFNVTDSKMTIQNGNNTYMAGQAVVTVDNSTWTAGSFAAIGSYGSNGYMAGNADVTLQNGSTYNAGNLEIFEAEGKTVKLTINNSTLNTTGALTISTGAEVYLNEGALINATDTLNNNGQIIVDVTDTWQGVAKIIDVAEGKTVDMTNIKLNDADAANGVQIKVNEDGDLLVYNVPVDKVYVNAAWNGKFAEKVAEGKYMDINAFNTLSGYVASESTKALEIAGGTYSQPEGDYTNSVSVIKGGITDITADGEVVIDKGSLVFATETAGEINISGDFTTTDKVRYTGTWGVDWAESQNGHIRFVGGDDTIFNIDGNFTSGENIQFIGGSAVISENSVLSNNPANWGQYLINGANVINKGAMSLELNAVNGSAMNILGGGSLTLSGEKASLNINMKDGGESNKDINVTNGSLNVEAGAKLDVTGAVTVAANGAITIDNAAFSAAVLTNSNVITIKGAADLAIGKLVNTDATLNIENFTNEFNLAVEGGTIKVTGELKLGADADIAGAVLDGGKLVISGADQTVQLAENSTVTLVVDEAATLTADDDLIGNVDITGEGVLTADDALFNGNKVSGVKLAITNADDVINVDAALADIAAINGNEVKNFDGIYYFTEEVTNDNGTPDDTSDDVISSVTNILSKDENGISYAAQGSGDGDGSVDGEKEFGNIVIDNKTGDSINPDLDVVMKKGTTTIKVVDDKKAEGKTRFEIGSISKNENGGKTNFNFGNNTDVDINGSVEAMGDLVVGKDSDLDIEGTLNGKNINQSIKIGANSTANFADIDLMGGKNSFSVAAGATVTAKDVEGITTLNLAAGKENDRTTMTVNEYVAAAANNSITLGNYADLTINGMIDNGGVESGTGTTINLGKGAVMLVGKYDDVTDSVTTTDINGLAGLTLASGSAAKFDRNGNEIAEEVNTIFAAGDVYGTEKNNTINVGNFGIFTADSINMFDGNDTIKTGSDSEFVVAKFDQQGNKDHADIVNVETISIGARSVLAAEDIIGVNKLTTGNGSYDKKADEITYTVLGTEGVIEGTAKNNTISLGNWNHAVINGDIDNVGIDLLDGNDTLKLGSDSVLLVGKDPQGAGNFDTADIANVETISIGARSQVVAEAITGVNKLTAANGVKDDTTQILATGTVTGTAKNDTISLGNWSAAAINGIDLLDGNDTLKIGNDSMLTVAGTTGYADIANVETISIGARSTFAAEDITGVNKLTAANGVKDDTTQILATGTVTGTAKNDTISLGNWSDAAINGIDLLDGNDSIKIGNNAIAHIASIDLGDGKDTVTLGKDSKIFVDEITNVETINASKGSQIITDSDVNFDAVGGSWKNATIMDIGNVLDDNAGTGAVYGNEWDLYDLDAGTTSVMIADETNSNTIYKVYEKGVWDEAVGEITSIDIQFIGSLDASKNYVLAVSVEGADFKNKEDEANKYSFTLA